MPVQREARYISSNDIGKTVTYEIPRDQYDPYGEQLLLGGVLQALEAEPRVVDDTAIADTERRLIYTVGTVILTISGNQVRMGPQRVVTLYGTDEE